MGVIGQRSDDITLRKVSVKPREGSGRMISTTVDATHFVNCGGEILIEDCVFENQIDDAVNVHGIYGRISRILGADTLEVQLMHYQQLGIDLFDPGAKMEFVRHDSSFSFHVGEVKSRERINKSFWRVTFDKELPKDIRVDDVVSNLNRQSNLTIRGCRAGKNRARGMLIKTLGKVLIEDNYFHTPGAALKIPGGVTHWYESGPVRDVTIRNNVFDNCNYGVWGNAVIDIDPAVAKFDPELARYHRNIRIEGNTFKTFDKWLVNAMSIDGLIIKGNKIIKTDAYPPYQNASGPFVIKDSLNVEIEDNEFVGF
jgi:hypothetical protein